MKNLLLVLGSVLFTLLALEGLARSPLGGLLPDRTLIYFDFYHRNGAPVTHDLEPAVRLELERKISQTERDPFLDKYSIGDNWRMRYAVKTSSLLSKDVIFFPRPNLSEVEIASIDSDEIYRVTYSIDAAGTRIIGPPVQTGKRSVVFVGDSFTFGEGVEGHETLPGHFQKLNPELHVFNFGVSGGSPSDILYEIQHKSSVRYEKVELIRPIFVFTLNEDEFERFRCRLGSLREDWRAAKPWYFYDEHKNLTLRGLCRDRWGSAWEKVVTHSQFFKKAGLNYPYRPTSSEFQLFADLILKIREEARLRWPGAEFVTVIHPERYLTAFDGLVPPMQERSLPLFDFRANDLFQSLGDRAIIPGDGHPTSIAHEVLAHLISFQMKNISNSEESSTRQQKPQPER